MRLRAAPASRLEQAGIDWVGVTDIDLMYTANWSDLSEAGATYGMPRLIGDRVADAAQLKATSPILNAARIRAPLLMAYGGKDRRVNRAAAFLDKHIGQP